MPSVWRGVPSQSLALGEPWHLFHRAGRPRSPNATWKQATAGECFLYANSSPIPKSPVLQAACIQKYRQMICAWHVPRHFFFVSMGSAMFSDPQVPLVHFDVQTLPIPRTHTCRTTCNKRSSACVSESRQLAHRRRPWAFGDRRTLPIAWTHRCLHATKNTGGEHVSLNARSWQIEGARGTWGGSENIAAPRHTCRTTCSSILTTCVSESKQLANRRAHWWTGRIADPLVDSTGRHAHTLRSTVLAALQAHMHVRNVSFTI